MDFFVPKSLLQERIENATAETLLKEDRAEFLKICDYIVSLPDGPKDALKTIKKRLKHKNNKVVLMTLELLQLTVNNCGERYHLHLVSKDFLPDFVKVIKTPGINRPIQEKMLDLIQLWSVGFASNTELSPAVEAHSQLLGEGYEFPPRDFATFEPISQIPRASATSMTSINSNMSRQHLFVPRGAPGVVLRPPPPRTEVSYNNEAVFTGGSYPGYVISRPPPHQQTTGGPMTNEKIRESLPAMKATVELFAETLAFINPEEEDVTRHELVKECHERCKRWQFHITNHLQNCTDETLFAPLLQLNDDYNARFDYYNECTQRYTRKHPQAAAAAAPAPTSFPASTAPRNTAPVPVPVPVPAPTSMNLISFDEVEQPLARGSQSASPQPAAQPPYFSSTYPFTNPDLMSQQTPQSQQQQQHQSFGQSASHPFSSPSSHSPAQEQGQESIKDILGIDPDEFTDDQLAQDLASLGFTKEQLMGSKEGTSHQGATGDAGHEGGHDDEFEALIDSRLSKQPSN